MFGVDAPEVRRGATPAALLAYEARDELMCLTRGLVGFRFVDRDRYGRFAGRAGYGDGSPKDQIRELVDLRDTAEAEADRAVAAAERLGLR